jgi:hypothetical protein
MSTSCPTTDMVLASGCQASGYQASGYKAFGYQASGFQAFGSMHTIFEEAKRITNILFPAGMLCSFIRSPGPEALFPAGMLCSQIPAATSGRHSSPRRLAGGGRLQGWMGLAVGAAAAAKDGGSLYRRRRFSLTAVPHRRVAEERHYAENQKAKYDTYEGKALRKVDG